MRNNDFSNHLIHNITQTNRSVIVELFRTGALRNEHYQSLIKELRNFARRESLPNYLSD